MIVAILILILQMDCYSTTFYLSTLIRVFRTMVYNAPRRLLQNYSGCFSSFFESHDQESMAAFLTAFAFPLSRGNSTFSVIPAFPRPSCRRPFRYFIPRCRSLSQNPQSSQAKCYQQEGVRINKCFKSFASRRESDAFIQHGRVQINGELAVQGARVFPGDVVQFDGRVIEWERLNVAADVDNFTYLKLWKDLGVVCTTDETIANNVVVVVPKHVRGPDRVFPVGRLDGNSTGLLLLTSDGRLPTLMLGAGKKCVKEYVVTPDVYVTDEDLSRLREGVVISTVAQRDRGVRKTLTVPTIPCEVGRKPSGNQLVFRLQEGRNRQIRKMLGALGYTARAIHRTAMMGITLNGLRGPGDVQPLNDTEMLIVREKLSGLQV